ncbi:hypothetical protein [Halomonas halocynthiae]|uniref:hypothetical protein n=1 Tax=Halomonas halocynthiae TaxID=176290 RepID=UPI000684CF4B|nr:hypothetical protein [Halomonas halocynthiae]
MNRSRTQRHWAVSIRTLSQQAFQQATFSRLLLLTALPVLSLGSQQALASQYQPDTTEASSYFYQGAYLTHLDNGLELQGDSVSSMDGVTSGFKLTAGFSPVGFPLLDFGAEIDYRESEEVPFVARQGSSQLVDTTSLGGSLLAGIRMGDFGVYAKSGIAGWQGEVITGRPGANVDGGMAQVNGFGAHLAVNGVVSRLNYERFDEPSLSHLNIVTASVHIPF